jgi:hypothetical protein
MTELIVTAVVAIFAAGVLIARQAAARLRKAQMDYEAALALLEADPSDNRLRIQALEKGRAFADIAREQSGSKGRAIFDEVALSNDLNARGGAGGVTETTIGADEKCCPDCAETVKKAARKCRFCGCDFTQALSGAVR